MEIRYRRRYVDMWANPETIRVFRLRSRIVSRIRRYLDEHSLTELVDGAIIGRRHGRPELMKPHPGPIEEALAALNVAPAAAVLIGDSVTDVIAARRAGIMCIGYANKTSKAQLLADADVVIADMRTLAERLRDSPLPE